MMNRYTLSLAGPSSGHLQGLPLSKEKPFDQEGIHGLPLILLVITDTLDVRVSHHERHLIQPCLYPAKG